MTQFAAAIAIVLFTSAGPVHGWQTSTPLPGPTWSGQGIGGLGLPLSSVLVQVADKEGAPKAGGLVITVQLRNTYADEVVEFLKRRLGEGRGTRITADTRTNRITLRGSAEKIRQAKTLLARIDQTKHSGMCIFRLRHANVVQTAALLKGLARLMTFLDDVGSRFRVTALAATNDVIVFNSTNEEEDLIEIIVLWLDWHVATWQRGSVPQ